MTIIVIIDDKAYKLGFTVRLLYNITLYHKRCCERRILMNANVHLPTKRRFSFAHCEITTVTDILDNSEKVL